MTVDWFDYQRDALDAELDTDPLKARVCLYFRTGAGKTYTALGLMGQWKVDTVLVIAPPSTHAEWVKAGLKFDISVRAISHAKFRQKTFSLSRTEAVIADEFHLFGGHNGQGWKKLDRLARGLQAPLVLASATPNYNDAERCYCVQHILDPASVKGGYIEFLYQNCITKQNPFGIVPHVTGFLNYPDAASYLVDLPRVYYVADEVQYTIDDIPISARLPQELETYGYNRRKHRVVASQMEMRHTRVQLSLINDKGFLKMAVYDKVWDLAKANSPTLVYANHSTVAEALAENLRGSMFTFGLVTGSTSTKEKESILQAFREGRIEILVGTASLATGTDGLDKVCDNLVILDDTDDASLRRQLIGRIMPRGASTDSSMKKVSRFRIV